MDDPAGQPSLSTDNPVDDETPIPFYGLRVAGFLITVVGALIVGIGAIQAWIDVVGVLTTRDLGIDLWQGKVTLALAVVALIAVLVTRIGATSGSRKVAAAVVLAAGLAIVGVALFTVVRGADDAIEEQIAQAGAAGLSPAALDTLRGFIQATLQIGVWLTLGGGVVVIAGGVLTLLWSSKIRYDDDAEAGSDIAPGPPSATAPA